MKSYKGYYYRFNSYKDCYEIGKYINGHWVLEMTCDRCENPEKEIDKEIRRIDNESNGSIK